MQHGLLSGPHQGIYYKLRWTEIWKSLKYKVGEMESFGGEVCFDTCPRLIAFASLAKAAYSTLCNEIQSYSFTLSLTISSFQIQLFFLQATQNKRHSVIKTFITSLLFITCIFPAIAAIELTPNPLFISNEATVELECLVIMLQNMTQVTQGAKERKKSLQIIKLGCGQLEMC